MNAKRSKRRITTAVGDGKKRKPTRTPALKKEVRLGAPKKARNVRFRRQIRYRPISPEQLLNIVAASRFPLIGDLSLLGHCLDDCAKDFIEEHHLQKLAPPAAITTRLKQIEKAAKRMLATLEIRNDDRSSIPFDLSSSISRFREWDKLETDAVTILALRNAAHDAAAKRKNHKVKGAARHVGDEARKNLVRALCTAYVQAFQKMPSLSAAESDSVFFSFALAVLTCIAENLSDVVKLSDPTIVDSLDPSWDAIRPLVTRWRNELNKRRDDAALMAGLNPEKIDWNAAL